MTAVIDSRTPGVLSVLSSSNTESPINAIRLFVSRLTGISTALVRARSAQKPGTRPSLSTNWASVAIEKIETSGTPLVVGKRGIISSPESGYSQVEAHQTVHVSVMFYGPSAQANADLFRVSCSLTQNTQTLLSSGLYLQSIDADVAHLPDYAFEQFCDRYEVKIRFGRKTVRSYGVRDFANAKDISLITERQE